MAERVAHEIPRFDKIAGAILNVARGDPQGGGHRHNPTHVKMQQNADYSYFIPVTERVE